MITLSLLSILAWAVNTSEPFTKTLEPTFIFLLFEEPLGIEKLSLDPPPGETMVMLASERSEERRVGKEC